MSKKLTTEEVKKRIEELTNGEYLLLGDYVDTHTKMLIKHSICGNEYKITWHNFQKGRRCQKCSGTKKLNNKEIDKRIEELVGEEYVRLSDYLGANNKLLVKHVLCQNIYEVTWSHFQTGIRCPKCKYLRLKELFSFDNQKIDKKMYELVGNEYIRIGKYVNNSTKMRVKHALCENVYEVKWGDFQQGVRCPKCNESKGEKEISNILNLLNIKYTSQKRFKECRHKRSLPFDFYIKNKKSKLLIEFDGRQHFESVEIFGGEEGLRETQIRDNIKNDFALSKNIPLLRIPYTEQDNIKQILTNKLKELNFI